MNLVMNRTPVRPGERWCAWALWLPALASLLFVPLSAARQAGTPTPALSALLAEVRQQLRNPEAVLHRNRYLQRVTDYDRDGSGRVTKTQVVVYEVYPDLHNGEGYARPIEKNGRPLPAAEAAALERDQQEKVRAAVRRRQAETADDRQKRLAGEAAAERSELWTIDDVFRLYDFRIAGRETIGNEPTIVLEFLPRRGVEPRTDSGRILAKAGGRLWVSEIDKQTVRLDLQSRDTITYGLGILARVRPGARLVFDRQRTTGGWFPVSYTLVARLMVLLVRPLDFDRKVEYYDFRPFPPAEPTAASLAR
jgi:hypothetical protein